MPARQGLETAQQETSSEPPSRTRSNGGCLGWAAWMRASLRASSAPDGRSHACWVIERAVDDLDLTAALVVADKDAGGRNARAGQLERMRRRAVREELLAAAQHHRHCEDAHRVDQIVGEQCMHELGTALRDEVRTVLFLQ